MTTPTLPTNPGPASDHAKRIVTWTTASRHAAEVVVDLQRVDGMSDLSITAWVDGVMVGYGAPKAIQHPTCVAAIGKLAMTPDNLARVQAAIDALTPEYERAQAIWQRVAAEQDEHARAYARIADA